MYLKKAFLLALFVALSLVACSDIEDEILYREDAAGVRFSPTKLQGTIDYLPAMAPKYVKVVNVDEQLNPVDSFEVSVDSGNSKNRAFEVASRDYEYPIVKIVPVFEQDNGTEMEFPQYVRLDKRNDNLKLNLFEALAAERTEELVREKDCSFDSARIQAVAELKKGRTEFRADKTGIVHASVGRMSFTPEQIVGNARAFLSTIIKLKPAAAKGTYLKSVFISSTMSRGIKIDTKSLDDATK